MPTFNHSRSDSPLTPCPLCLNELLACATGAPPERPTIHVDLKELVDLERNLETIQRTLSACQAENTRLVEENRRLKAGTETARTRSPPRRESSW